MAKKQEKIGLALGGGGARGLAHIGAVEALVEKRSRLIILPARAWMRLLAGGIL